MLVTTSAFYLQSTLRVYASKLNGKTVWIRRVSPRKALVFAIPQWQKAAQDEEADPNEEPRDPDKLYTVLISTKSFLKFLNSHVVSTTTIACTPCKFLTFTRLSIFFWVAGICQHHCVILYVYIGDVSDAGGVLTFYIPAIIDDEGRWPD